MKNRKEKERSLRGKTNEVVVNVAVAYVVIDVVPYVAVIDVVVDAVAYVVVIVTCCKEAIECPSKQNKHDNGPH